MEPASRIFICLSPLIDSPLQGPRLATCGTGSELLACAGSHDFED
jgi:hypothetical protein